jgi:hypothetical protein
MCDCEEEEGSFLDDWPALRWAIPCPFCALPDRLNCGCEEYGCVTPRENRYRQMTEMFKQVYLPEAEIEKLLTRRTLLEMLSPLRNGIIRIS